MLYYTPAGRICQSICGKKRKTGATVPFFEKGVDFFEIYGIIVKSGILGCSQAVRHQTLTLAFVGPNPATPATLALKLPEKAISEPFCYTKKGSMIFFQLVFLFEA